MSKNKMRFWIWNAVFALIIAIGALFGFQYYQQYIKPESFTVGSVTMYDYVPVTLKTYISEGDLLFAQDISDCSFQVVDNTATYEYQFGAIEFDADKDKYIIFINETPLGILTQSGNTISGYLNKTYYDAEDNYLFEAPIKVQFSAQSKTTTLKVSLDRTAYSYLKAHMAVNNFVITLAKSPYEINEVVGTIPVNISSLTVQFNDGINRDIVINGYEGMQYTLAYPGSDDYIFNGFNIVSGNGTIKNNVFTFGTENTVVQADLTAKQWVSIFEGSPSFGAQIVGMSSDKLTLDFSNHISVGSVVNMTDYRVVLKITYLGEDRYLYITEATGVDEVTGAKYELLSTNKLSYNTDKVTIDAGLRPGMELQIVDVEIYR